MAVDRDLLGIPEVLETAGTPVVANSGKLAGLTSTFCGNYFQTTDIGLLQYFFSFFVVRSLKFKVG
jgi:hypothetical protein